MSDRYKLTGVMSGENSGDTIESEGEPIEIKDSIITDSIEDD